MILDHALAHPCHGTRAGRQELMLLGIQLSSGGVRGFCQRHGLLTKQSNGIVERLHPYTARFSTNTSCFKGRRTWFEPIEEMQAVLEVYLDGYNNRCAVTGPWHALAALAALPRDYVLW